MMVVRAENRSGDVENSRTGVKQIGQVLDSIQVIRLYKLSQTTYH